MTSERSKWTAHIMEGVCPACLTRRLGVVELVEVDRGEDWSLSECPHCWERFGLRRAARGRE